jgi:HNH endonuclease
MTHGPTRIPSRGTCIYCGASGVRLTDEHVIPLALGGFHILEGASCDDCARITTRFERDVAREIWGDARTSYNAPTRRKKERKTHIILSDPNDPSKRVKVPYSEYPAAMVFYKMGRAGLLEGLPDTVDVSSAWQFIGIHDQGKAKGFKEKWGVPLTSRFRHVPESFARLLAKIGYCNLLCALEPGDFRPICVPYILGTKPNPSYVVGGTFEIAEPTPGLGYVLRTAGFIENDRLMLITEIRLFADNATPTYHAVVGDVRGRDRIDAVLKKIGLLEITGADMTLKAPPTSKSDHWAPSVRPLPFWNS